MMRDRRPVSRPESWRELRQKTPAWALPFRGFNWVLAWCAFALSHWALLDLLEHLGTFSVLVAVIFYFADSGNRTKQKHYQAWQVINTAQGKGGNGGRIDAMQELNDDRVSLVGVDASNAFLFGVRLQGAQLDRCNLAAADLRNANMRFAHLAFGDLESSNLRQADLTGADLSSANLQDADLNQATLQKANLMNADLSRVDLRFADVKDMQWKDIRSLQLANIYGVRNASSEFLDFARKHGAVSFASDEEWTSLMTRTRHDP